MYSDSETRNIMTRELVGDDDDDDDDLDASGQEVICMISESKLFCPNPTKQQQMKIKLPKV